MLSRWARSMRSPERSSTARSWHRAIFTWMSVRLLRDPTPALAMRLFTYSITYLTLLWAAMAVDVLVEHGL